MPCKAAPRQSTCHQLVQCLLYDRVTKLHLQHRRCHYSFFRKILEEDPRASRIHGRRTGSSSAGDSSTCVVHACIYSFHVSPLANARAMPCLTLFQQPRGIRAAIAAHEC